MSCRASSGRTSIWPRASPPLSKFLDFWEHNLDGKVHRVRVANAQLVKPAEFRFACGLYALH